MVLLTTNAVHDLIDEELLVGAYVSEISTPGSCMDLRMTIRDFPRATLSCSPTKSPFKGPPSGDILGTSDKFYRSESILRNQAVRFSFDDFAPDYLYGGLT